MAFGVYLKKELITRLSSTDLKTLMQLLRISGQLNFWLRIRSLLKEDYNKLFDFRNKVELLFHLILNLKEGTKTFYRDLLPDINEALIPIEIKDKLETLKARIDNRVNDEYFKIVEYIRNNISSHNSEDIYNGFIKEEGQEQNDLLIGIAVGNSIREFLITEPYTAIFMKISEMIPENIGKEKFYDWLLEQTIKETGNFLNIVNVTYNTIIDNEYYIKQIDELGI